MKNPQFASLQLINEAVESESMVTFVWPDEGEFDKNGRFRFNAEHKGFEPLIIDLFTASMLKNLYNSVNTANKTKVNEYITKSRGHFGRIIEIGWSCHKR